MEHKVVELTGAPVDNGPVRIEGLELYQNNQLIGKMTQETLEYLIENRKELQVLKFINSKTDKDGKLISVTLFSSLRTTKPVKSFSRIRVIYYGAVIIAALIMLIYSLFFGSVWWVNIFLVLTILSTSYLLYDYLVEHGRLKRFDE